ncbi:hypothetical protein CC86DRAFT_315813 [Ophiobolus disseminans]|uniref:Metallo-dependent hydrolase n=1 Tax=Ophiobolus disseminans TaxID=1469910 RepID=A0A6A7AB00_9PLEO|nr:hypothetical protein CC86DRAFT_315813 [Ophiobolus disseminans]
MDQKHGQTIKKIVGVRIPNETLSKQWDITIEDGIIACVDPHDSTINTHAPDVLAGANRLIAPSLCHAHVHLDKCFLLQDPKFSDLRIESGDFKEAMEMTGEAKSRFEEEDLLRRGGRLIEESIQHGVTAMRAFVEVDGVVQLKCLHAGLKLKDQYKDRCQVQICAFAQLPLFSGKDDGAEVRKLMATAAADAGVEVLGSTPYVEDDMAKSAENVHWITQLALEHNNHLDLHLDYFLEEDKQPLVWDVLRILKELEWPTSGGRLVTLGHCTRLTRFQKEDWQRLRREIGGLPVSFVGLPTSDLFMMRTPDNLRGTLPIPDLINQYGLNAAISINNVGNAFTPQGNCDPLSLAQLGNFDIILSVRLPSSVTTRVVGTPAQICMERHRAINASITWCSVQDQQRCVGTSNSGRLPYQVTLLTQASLGVAEICQIRFGEHSHETTAIYETLGRFGRGEIAKKDAMSIVAATLGTHYDLKCELTDILKHKDSQWGPGDFDLSLLNMPELPNPQTAPPFLQPNHQPEMRLPSMSTLWESHHDPTSPVSQADFNDSSIHGTLEESNSQNHPLAPIEHAHQQGSSPNVPSSPAVSAPTRSTAPVELICPAVEHTAIQSLHPHDNRDEPMGGEDSTAQQQLSVESWERTQYNQNWAHHGVEHSFEHEQSSISAPYSPAVSYEARHPHNLNQGQLSPSCSPEPSVLGASFAIPIGQPTVDMPPPPRKRNRKSSLAKVKAVKQQDDFEGEPVSRDIQHEEAGAGLKASRNPPDESGQYIHSLCGKGFVTRSKVKKHHWGGKINNLETSTGCWAKHKKPNVDWDDHPSCKEGPHSSTKAKKIKRQSMAPEDRAPAVPAMATRGVDSPPRVTDLENVPEPVEEALNSPSRVSRYAPGDHLPYHSHQFPRSPFENLLTAVNLASNIEAPVPQGRNDSVVSQLDAQALAAERAGQYLPTWSYSSYQCDPTFEYVEHHRPTYEGFGQGFGTLSVSPFTTMNAVYPPMMHRNSYACSAVSPTEVQAEFGGHIAAGGHNEDNAMNQNYYSYLPHPWELPRSPLSPEYEMKERYNV